MHFLLKRSRALRAAGRSADSLAIGTVRGSRSGLAFGAVLAVLWGFHAAAYALPGRAYFRFVGLNDISKPVGPNVLFMPAFICALLFVALRSHTGRRVSHDRFKGGLAVSMACWLLGATLSTVINANIDQVVLTYCSVFLAGAAVYMALASVSLTARDLEVAVLGLVAGSLFPLIGGLQAFTQEWGVPDTSTTLNAYLNLARMETYEAATFGNRGNTAGFIVIVAPLLLWMALDKSRTRITRLVCAATLVPAILNLLVIEIRAALLIVLLVLAVIWGFKLGVRRYPVFAVALGAAFMLFTSYSPDIALMMSDRLKPIIMANAEEDTSLAGRGDAMKEGMTIASRSWALGIGPGGALSLHTQTSAHQFQLQQFMELGVLGLVGSTVFSLGILLMLARTLARGQDGGVNNIRFALLIGPASYVMYGLLANAALNVGYVNTWCVLIVSMVALTPPFERRTRPVSTRTPALAPRLQLQIQPR